MLVVKCRIFSGAQQIIVLYNLGCCNTTVIGNMCLTLLLTALGSDEDNAVGTA